MSQTGEGMLQFYLVPLIIYLIMIAGIIILILLWFGVIL